MNQIQMAPLTPVVKKLMIAMGAVWFVGQIILEKFLHIGISQWFLLFPNKVISDFWMWQTFTYMFFHALSPFHLFFNCLMLWFVGSELEKHWGPRFFSIYLFTCGVGAAMVYCIGVALYAVISGNTSPLLIPVAGASGAIFGLLVAYGIIFSERTIYFMGLIPLKAKHFAMLAALMDLLSLFSTGFAGGEVAYLAHLGGALVGFLFLWGHTRVKLLNTKSKVKKSTSLRLVVDNEKKDPKDPGPKYWN